MKYRHSQFLLSLTALAMAQSISFAHADEGMWVFNNLPKKELEEKYGFKPTPKWVDHVMKSSVRFNSGGSGSFISSNGLVLTNHHVAADTLEKVSTPAKNFYQDGFYAKTLDEEIKAPDLEINQLIAIEDVTSQVNSSVKPEMTPAQALAARRAAMATLEKASFEKTGLRSDVVTLYGGGQYHLYQYKKYTDVRVVFAPEFDIAFFGGDHDNFEYPRYDLDMAIFRVYENGKPAVIADHLTWSTKGAGKNELVFVSGNPGRTSRMFTYAHVEFMRDLAMPDKLSYLERIEKLLNSYRAQGPEQARRAQDYFFSIQNSLKAYRGEIEGLRNAALMASKREVEDQLKQKMKADASLAPGLEAIEQVAKAQGEYKKILLQRAALDQARGFNSDLFKIARNLVRIAAEDQKPNSDRLPEYRESGRDSLLQQLFSEAPVYEDFEKLKLADSLAYLQGILGAAHPLVQKVLAGKSPTDRANELIDQSKLKDVSVRKHLLEGGMKAIEESSDPMVLLAKGVDDESRAVRKQYEDSVEAPQTIAYGIISKVLFAIHGDHTYPDATFTPRLAFGVLKGYHENNGKFIPPYTQLGGAFHHEQKHGAKVPFKLPESWHKNGTRLNYNTPFNFISTVDIIGGNSGSPVINRDGELVGLIFDGNIQSLVADYVYDDKQGRAVSVDSRGIVEALAKIYKVKGLLDQFIEK